MWFLGSFTTRQVASSSPSGIDLAMLRVFDAIYATAASDPVVSGLLAFLAGLMLGAVISAPVLLFYRHRLLRSGTDQQ